MAKIAEEQDKIHWVLIVALLQAYKPVMCSKYQLSKLQEEMLHDEVAAAEVNEDADAASTAGCQR